MPLALAALGRRHRSVRTASLLTAGAMAGFFRHPPRVPPNRAGIVVSPADGEVALSDLENEVLLVLSLDLADIDLFDESRSVMRVNDRLADLENHVLFSPFATLRISRVAHVT